MAFAALAPIVGMIGTAVSAFGTIAGANANASALEYQAEVARRKGTLERATAQRQALETTEKTKKAMSAVQARSAASGGGADDDTVVNLMEGIAGQGTYYGKSQQAQGDVRNWDYQTDAVGKTAQASATRSAGTMSAFGTILGGVSGMLKAAGGGGFQLPSAGSTFETAGPDDFWKKKFPDWTPN